MEQLLTYLLVVAGVGQIFIALIYNWVRDILGWDEDIARMRHPWNRQIAHTYSRYIQGLNFAFGLLTLLFTKAFFEANALATALAVLLSLYWGGRLAVALFYYNTEAITRRRRLFRYGGWSFNALFLYLAMTYAGVAWINL